MLMKCHKIIALLGPYLDGECSPSDRLKVEKHLRKCPACRSQLEQLRLIEISSRRLIQPDPGEDYWNTFLPRVRRRIDQDHRRPVPVRLRERLGRLFAPPVPWFRLAGTVAVAVLVLVIGRAVIHQRGRPGSIRAPAEGPRSEQVQPTRRDTEGSLVAKDRGVVDQEEQTVTAPAEELSGTTMEGSPSAEPTPSTGQIPQKAREPVQTKKGPPETRLVAPPVRPSANAEGQVSKEKAAGRAELPTATGTAEDRTIGSETRTMARAAAGQDWRGWIRHWERVIESHPDRTTLAAAHLSLAESWYRLAMSSADQDDVSAALQAHQAALEFAAEDSTQQRLRERISTLEDRLQKK
jgi:anti-sigma factor RsiW